MNDAPNSTENGNALVSQRCRTALARAGWIALMLAVLTPWLSVAQNRLVSHTRSGVVQAEEFGSLQAAVEALPDSGAVLELPPGRILLDSTVIVPRGALHIRGSGPSTHLVNRNESGDPALLIRPPRFGEEESAEIWDVRLSDFRISGNPSSGDGIRIVGVNQLHVEGLTVDHHGRHGLHLIDTYENPRIRGNNITYNDSTGIQIEAGHDLVVADNQFEENRDALRAIDSYNLTMTGNNLDDHLRHGVVIENTYGSVLSGNMIEESQGTAIILDRDCYGITLSANVLAHNFSGGIDLRDAWGIAVSANTFTIDAQYGVQVGPNSGRVTITGNNFSDAHVGPGLKRDDAAGGVVLDRTEAVTISGNVFSGLTAKAVRTDGSTGEIVVTGNLITDTPRDSTSGTRPVRFDNPPAVLESNWPDSLR